MVNLSPCPSSPFRRNHCLLILPSTALILCCTAASEPPPVFGGQGAQLDPDERPLPEGDDDRAGSGPCAKPAPSSTDTLLEDFEDGDHHLFKVFERDGWWYTATDDTSGTVYPPRDGFKPTLLPEGEGTPENRFAAHFTAEGFTDWGVVWGTTLTWVKSGVKCPFNASAFTGLRFRAKGSGQLRVNFGNPATVPSENGGKCKTGCWDTHGKIIHFTPEWEEHLIAFDRLQQGGWGTDAPFEPERLLTLNFNANPEYQPVDVWIDDLQWVTSAGTTEPQKAAPEISAAEASAPAPTAP